MCPPSADVVPVRRAICPSTTSRTSASDASDTSRATGTESVNESATSAATPTVSAARVSVTQSAGPSRSVAQ